MQESYTTCPVSMASSASVLIVNQVHHICLDDNTEMETINKIRTELTLHLKDYLHFNKQLSWRYKHIFVHIKLESCIIPNQNL